MTTDEKPDAAARIDPYLDAIGATLWPPPARRRVRSGRAGLLRRTGAKDFLVLPTAARPKLVVPARPRRTAAAAVRHYKTTRSVREQLAMAGVSAAVRIGAADLLGDRLLVDGCDARGYLDLESHISQAIGQDVRIALYIGPPRAVRKPVLQVIDARSATIAFAKLGIDEFTDELVRSETESVEFVGAAGLRRLRVPSVRHAGEWHGHALLVQSAFPAGRDAVPGSPVLAAAMDEVARVTGVERMALGHSHYLAALVERARRAESNPYGALVADRLDRLAELGGDVELEFGSWHGDWLPWNMTVTGETVALWDWEKFTRGAPIGFDATHYDVQRAVLTQGVSPAAAFAATLDRRASVVGFHGLDERAAAVVVWLYAVDLCLRYIEDDEMGAGRTVMSRLDSWAAATFDHAEHLLAAR